MISEEVYRTAALPSDTLPQHEVFVTGREASIRVRTATTTADLGAAMTLAPAEHAA